MERGTIINIWNNGKYLLNPSKGGKYVAISGCPAWFRKGDTVTYKVTDVNSQKTYSIGEYAKDTRIGYVLNKDNRGFIVRPKHGGKLVKVRRPQPWVAQKDLIPYEILQFREKQGTDEGILADRSIDGSIVAITFIEHDGSIPSEQEGVVYCCMSNGGTLYENVINRIRHTYFNREDLEEPNPLKKDKKEDGLVYRWGWHLDPDFLRSTLSRQLENFDVNTGRIKKENRLIHLEELFPEEADFKEIRRAGNKWLHLMGEILRINSIDIMKERLFR